MMASQLPGRSDNEIKNHWNAHLKNVVQKNEHRIEQVENLGQTSKAYIEGCSMKISNFKIQDEVAILLAVLSSGSSASSSTSTELSSRSCNRPDYVAPSDVTPQFSKDSESFWTQPCLLDNESINISSPLGPTTEDQVFFQDNIMDDVLFWSTMNLY